jgi:hypothetical protein
MRMSQQIQTVPGTLRVKMPLKLDLADPMTSVMIGECIDQDSSTVLATTIVSQIIMNYHVKLGMRKITSATLFSKADLTLEILDWIPIWLRGCEDQMIQMMVVWRMECIVWIQPT